MAKDYTALKGMAGVWVAKSYTASKVSQPPCLE